jgi:hypothetical protein
MTITGVDQSSTLASGLGCGSLTKKVMQLAVVTSAGVYNASWTLSSIAAATSQNYVYTFGVVGDGTVVNTNTMYASVALTSFSIANLTTVALSIA